MKDIIGQVRAVPDILLRNISPETLAWLKREAASHERSVQAELRAIVEAELERRTRDDFWERAAELRRALGPQRTSSVDLIREDRDSDYGSEP